MTYFQLRPLDRWPLPDTPDRKDARFRLDWDRTLEQLVAEADKLDAGPIAVQIVCDGDDIRKTDGMLKSKARVLHPGVRVSFTSKHGPLTYATDAYTYWQDNVRAIALSLEALRAVDRYGVSKSGEQYRGWTQIGSGSAGTSDLTPDEAFKVLVDAAMLNGPITIPVSDLTHLDSVFLTQLYRQAARATHPDRWPERADAFALIGRARNILATHLPR